MSFVMMLGGCGRTELKEAEAYNSFSKETLCTRALTGGWNEEIAAYDEDTCILVKGRIVGEPEEAVLENEFYSIQRETGMVEKPDMDVYQKEEMNSEYGYEPSVYLESDSEYIYIYQEMSECMKLDVLNSEMEVIYTQKEKIEDSAYISCPNLSLNCLFARVQGEDVLFF